MGTSMPPQPRWAPDTPPAEVALWRWAVSQLDDRVLVLPQVAMTVGRGGRTEEAEADLVLIDPTHGVTVVEVKGGTMSYDATQAVWRRREAGSAAIRDPAQQAKTVRSVLRKALRASGVDTATLALRWAVATPECRLAAPGEPVLSDSQLWDSLAADQLAMLYHRTCGALRTGEQPLGVEAAGHLARVLRGRSREGRPSLAVAIDDHEEQVRIHAESHRNVLRRFATHRHVLVRGAAGTGKTVLALEAAAQFASLGERVLLVCWNVVLAHWLRDELRRQLQAIGSPAATEVTRDPTGRVVVTHVADLVAGAAIGQPGADRDTWFHEQLPLLLTPQVTAGEFDVVVLDEAQDLSELWVLAVAGLVARSGRWYAFADGQQDLFDADTALPDLLEIQHELRENFRNTVAIAHFAQDFGHLELDCIAGEGPEVRFVAVDGEVVDASEHMAGRLQREERLSDAELAVLWLFHNPYKGQPDTLAALTRTGGLVRTNSASFKGMERPAVVLGLDLDARHATRVEDVRRAIYAAATRARSLLVVVGDPQRCASLGYATLAKRLQEAHDASH